MKYNYKVVKTFFYQKVMKKQEQSVYDFSEFEQAFDAYKKEVAVEANFLSTNSGKVTITLESLSETMFTFNCSGNNISKTKKQKS